MPGKYDEDIPTAVMPTTPIQGPVTRARARQLNYQVLSFLGASPTFVKNVMLPKSDMLLMLRNQGPSLKMGDGQGDDGSKVRSSQVVLMSDYYKTLKLP